MKKLISLILALFFVLTIFVGCGEGKLNSTEPAKTESKKEAEESTKATDTLTDEPTSVPTEITTEKLSVKARLQQGYWMEKQGENGIMVFTFDGEKLYNDYYEIQNGAYVKIDGPGYSNSCIPEIYSDTFLVYSTGGVTNEFYFTDDPKVVKSYEDEYGYVRTWTNYDSIPSVPAKKTTQADINEDNDDMLETGVWVCYSPQDVVFDAYEFSDGIVVDKSYKYVDGVVSETGIIDTYMTYEIQGDKIVILDEYGYEREWSFTDDPSVITYSWQDYLGPEPGPVVTQKIYHHKTIPTYDEAVKEKENMWVK
ncbi:MAG: hypothetical protein IJ433_02325 [Ruminococcus sp.]|nr:hypothetical protein [Ruminococcus sp.]